MKAWDFESGSGFNADKMRDLRALFPAAEPLILWQFLVFLHRCNFQGTLNIEDTQAILNMLQGPMYTEAAFVAMETPLLNTLIALRAELKEKDPAQYLKQERHWMMVADQMERARDSSHRVFNQDEGRANEYIVAARS
jgi:hypothetical protein